MQETLQALLGLQEIDRLIFKVESELRRLPAEVVVRQKALDLKLQGLEEIQRESHELRTRIKEIEDVTTQQRQRQRKLEGEANKTKTDAAMLAAYDHEIRSIKRTVGQAEDDGLELVEQVEGLEQEAARIQAELEEEQSTFDEFRGNVERETAEAEDRLASLRQDLESKSSSGISAEQLSLYKRLLGSREGEAMAELHGRICQGCFVEIPKNLAVRLARGLEMVQCLSCDRILYFRY